MRSVGIVEELLSPLRAERIVRGGEFFCRKSVTELEVGLDHVIITSFDVTSLSLVQMGCLDWMLHWNR